MNPSIAHISGGREIHGEGEYDPFGKYVTKYGTQFHLREAHDNFSDKDQQKLSDLSFTASASGSDYDKARAFDHFIKCANKYWLWQYAKHGEQGSN